jgi:hypothetical protein
MQDVFVRAERVLAAVAALALFALNDVRMFETLPRALEAGGGRVHGVSMQLWGATELVYAGAGDLALRWGLAGLTAGLCLWALAETLPRQKLPGPQDL